VRTDGRRTESSWLILWIIVAMVQRRPTIIVEDRSPVRVVQNNIRNYLSTTTTTMLMTRLPALAATTAATADIEREGQRKREGKREITRARVREIKREEIIRQRSI
jgi:hypothetical protein